MSILHNFNKFISMNLPVCLVEIVDRGPKYQQEFPGNILCVGVHQIGHTLTLTVVCLNVYININWSHIALIPSLFPIHPRGMILSSTDFSGNTSCVGVHQIGHTLTLTVVCQSRSFLCLLRQWSTTHTGEKVDFDISRDLLKGFRVFFLQKPTSQS